MEYKVGDKVTLKKKSELRQYNDNITKHTTVTIVEVDDIDDDLPYLVSYIDEDGDEEKAWLMAREIKGLASVIKVGGE